MCQLKTAGPCLSLASSNSSEGRKVSTNIKPLCYSSKEVLSVACQIFVVTELLVDTTAASLPTGQLLPGKLS